MFYTLSRHNPLWSAIQKSDLWVLDAQWGELLQDVERPWAFATPLPAEDANLYCFGEHFSGPNWFTRLKRNVAILSVIDADGNCHLDRASCQFWIYWNWKPHPKTSETIIKYQILHCRVKLIRNMHAAMIRDDNWLTYTDTHTHRERERYIYMNNATLPLLYTFSNPQFPSKASTTTSPSAVSTRPQGRPWRPRRGPCSPLRRQFLGPFMVCYSCWLVVWNIWIILLLPYIGKNNPNWLSYFSEGLKPPTSLWYVPVDLSLKDGDFP